MVTITSKKPQRYVTGISGKMEEICLIEAIGLSTDDKPLINVGNGSMYIEMDTKSLFFYDEENHMWWNYSGGGN